MKSITMAGWYIHEVFGIWATFFGERLEVMSIVQVHVQSM